MQRELTTRSLPLEGDENSPNRLETKIYYQKGDPNYFSGGSMKRGYYMGVTPVKVTGTSRSFMAFSGASCILEEAARFSQKRFHEVVVTYGHLTEISEVEQKTPEPRSRQGRAQEHRGINTET